MRAKFICNALSVLLVAAGSLTAAGLPELAFPSGVGVNIHFTTGHEEDLDRIAAAGFKVVRMDFGWGGIERRKGQYDWSAYEELTGNLEKRGLRALYILDYSNALYEETQITRNPITGGEQRATISPQHPESVAAFARWAGAAARHFKGRGIIWEIWNEPNIFFWKPKPDVGQYITLAKETCRAIRAADAEALIVAPATSEFPWQFLEQFFQSGILEELDGISVHPYRPYSKSPETVAPDYARLKEMIYRYATSPARRRMPILSGEWGYASHTKGVSLETQAAFAARQQLVNLLHQVPVSIWYDWKNDGPDPAEREHNFGVVDKDLNPKPAFDAIQTLTRELAGYRIEKRLSLPDEKDYVLKCTAKDLPIKLAAWTLEKEREMALKVKASESSRVKIVSSRGETGEVKIVDGYLRFRATAAPFYITLEQVTLENEQ